ncbi:hypothetical protein WG66_004081 [Moniliophthora roreri]|nr:hypothetical protein WG66_004081 [Moniliophthora roreri]
MCRDNVEERDSLSPIDPTLSHPTLVLSHVCSQWRYLSFSSPEVWSYINVKIQDFDDEESSEVIHQFTLLYLNHSKDRPLDIEFDIIGASSFYRGALDRPIWTTLLKHSDRWLNLTLRLRRQDPLVLPRMPLLESLDITKDETLYFHSEQLRLGTMTAFQAPNLRHLMVQGHMREHGISRFFDTKSLTTLDLCYFDLEDLLHILKNATGLLEVTFGFMNPPSAESTIGRVTSNLRTLAALGIPSFQSLFSYVTLPSLNDLQITSRNNVQDPQVFYDFLHRSQPPITKFHFDAKTLSRKKDLVRVLQMMPSISELGYHEEETVRAFVLSVIKSGDNLPSLNRLEMYLTCDFDKLAVFSMLQERLRRGSSKTGKKLKSFKLQCHPDHLDDEDDGLKSLQAEGLKVELVLDETLGDIDDLDF